MAQRKRAAGRPGPFKKIMAVVFSLLALGVLAFLFFMFRQSGFMVEWFKIVLQATCGVAAVGVIWLLILYLSS